LWDASRPERWLVPPAHPAHDGLGGLPDVKPGKRTGKDESMDQQIVSFDLQDKAQLEMSRSWGGLPRLSVSAADDSYAVEFVHTRDSDPWVSMAFFRSLSDQAQQAAEILAGLISHDISGDTDEGTSGSDGGSSWDDQDSGV
jgi:hypothetical protein